MSSVRQRAISGVRWCLASHGGRQIIQILTTIALVRLLSPGDFGIMAMAMVIVGLSTLLQDLGTSAAIVHLDDPSPRLLSSIFWLNTACGTVLAGLVILVAPLVAWFYTEPVLEPLLVVLSVVFISSGACSVHAALMQRALGFRSLARVELMATIVGSIAGIGAALNGAGVASLAAQALANATTTTALLWVASSWRPRFVFSWCELRAISGYSMGLTGFKVVNYVRRHLDYVLIGRFLGATELGWYTLAYKLMLYPVQHVSAVVGRVMFPVYARWKNDHGRLRDAYVKVAAAIATLTFPVMIGIVAVSDAFVTALLGPAWAPVAPLLMILAPLGMLQSMATSLGGIYQATGRTGLLFAWGIVASTVMAAAFIVGVRWGLLGIACAYAVANVLGAYPTFAIPFRLIRLPMRTYLAALWRPAVCSAVMGAVVIAATYALPDTIGNGRALLVQVMTGFIVYAVMSWCVNRDRLRDVFSVATPLRTALP